MAVRLPSCHLLNSFNVCSNGRCGARVALALHSHSHSNPAASISTAMISQAFLAVLCNPEIVDCIAAEASPRDPQSVICTLSKSLPLAAVVLATNRTRHWRSIVADGNSPMSQVHQVHRQLARFIAGGQQAPLRLRLRHFGWNMAGVAHTYGLLNAAVAARVVEFDLDMSPPATAGGWGPLATPRPNGRFLADPSLEAMNSVLRLLEFAMPLLEIVRLTVGIGMSWPHTGDDNHLSRRFLRRAPHLRVLDLDTAMPLHAVRLSSYPNLVRLEARIPIPASDLMQLAIACPNLQHLLVFIDGTDQAREVPIFPCLHTMAAVSDELLKLIGDELHTPVLRKVLLEDNPRHPVTNSLLETTVMREDVPMAFGIAGRVEATSALVDILLAAVDASMARGNPRPTLIFNSLDVAEIRSFSEDVLQRNPHRIVHNVTMSECDLTGAAVLSFMSAALQIVRPGGELRFIGCRSLTCAENPDEFLIGDEWRQAIEAARDVIVDAGVRLTIA